MLIIIGGNILISEEGDVQLCDFGVAGIIETNAGKRSTIIGTPFWMPPEMHSMDPDSQEGYGTEVDCWAFGCTVYEMATGMPPNHKFHPSMLRTILKAAPRLQDGNYSQELRDFVAFCLEERPQDRPTAEQILEHPYIADTSEEYPTATLRQMIDRYVQWERKGGQRASLFNPYGAAAPQIPEEQEDVDDWNFSITDHFDRDFTKRYSQLGIAATDFAMQEDEPVATELPSFSARGLTPFQQAQEEAKAKRGEKSMVRLFDPNAAPYDYNTLADDDDEEEQLSDLPLRNMSSDRSANRETMIDLDMGGLDSQPTFSFDIGDVPTLRAAPRASVVAFDDDENDDEYYASQGQDTKRATKEWKMPWSVEPQADENAKRKTQDWKMPWGEAALTEVKANRRTQDWTFPLSEIATENPSRRTQDWTFATAEVADVQADTGSEFTFPPAQSEDDIVPGFRPHLTRTATEPIGQYHDFLHPPAHITLTSENDAISVRDSTATIDLDMAMGPGFEPNFDFDNTAALQSRQPSPAVSVAGSTETRRNPFFLDEVDRVLEEEGKRRSHRQSRSEPHLLPPSTRASRLLHSRGPSTESILRHNRDRGYSLSSTASSDVLETSWGRDYNRRMGEHTRDQLMNDLHMAAIAPRGPGAHSRMNSYDTDIDTMDNMGPTGIQMPGIDSDNFPLAGKQPLRSVSRLGESIDEGGYSELHVPRSRSRAGTGTTTGTSNGYDSSRDEAQYLPRRSTRMFIFPRVLAPDPEAMGEMADQDVVDQELDRLLEDVANGLGAAADAFSRRDREVNGQDDGDDIQHHFKGFNSEGDGEGMYY